MKQLEILFIHPNASRKIYQELSQNYSAIETPHWSGMLANHCRLKGISCRILDCEAENLLIGESVRQIKEYNARLNVVVVYRTTTKCKYSKYGWCSRSFRRT